MAKRKKELVIPDELVMSKILLIRGKKVMIDRDLAELYGVPTKRLNEQVKRNIKRFPKDFMFQLTVKEKDEAVANCDHLGQLLWSDTMTQRPSILRNSKVYTPPTSPAFLFNCHLPTTK